MWAKVKAVLGIGAIFILLLVASMAGTVLSWLIPILITVGVLLGLSVIIYACLQESDPKEEDKQ